MDGVTFRRNGLHAVQIYNDKLDSFGPQTKIGQYFASKMSATFAVHGEPNFESPQLNVSYATTWSRSINWLPLEVPPVSVRLSLSSSLS